nr:VanZ family protein [Maliibacterium massiliense]
MESFIPFTSVVRKGLIDFSVPDAMLIALGIYLLLLPIAYRKRRLSHKIYLGLLYVYCGAVAALTIFPMIFPPQAFAHLEVELAVQAINWKPLELSLRMLRNSVRAFLYNAGGNFIMLMPLAVLVTLLHERMGFFPMLLLASGVSAGIEGFQLLENMVYFSYNSVDIDDFIFNVAGCMVAYVLFVAGRGIVRAIRRKCAA